jgi:hypothetical protein
MKDRSLNEVIHGCPNNKGAFTVAIAQMEKEKFDPGHRASNIYSVRETQRGEAGLKSYIIIGYALRDREQDVKLKINDEFLKKQMPVSNKPAQNVYP